MHCPTLKQPLRSGLSDCMVPAWLVSGIGGVAVASMEAAIMNSAASSKIIRAGALLAINRLFLATWALAGPAKFSSHGVPQWFVDSFGKSFLATFPGTAVAYYSMAIMETLAAAALVKGEFLRAARPVWLEATLVPSLLIFVQRLIGDFDKAAMLFHYFTGTAVCLLLVRNLRSETVPKV